MAPHIWIFTKRFFYNQQTISNDNTANVTELIVARHDQYR